MNLKENFFQLCFHHTQDQILVETLWFEIEKKYSKKGRYYHNIEHLDHLFSEIDWVKDKISSFTNLSFSVFYHDIIYDPTSKINEEKSAEFAKNRLKKLGLNPIDLTQISEQILATKSHEKADDHDTDYLMDADLSILGKDHETYVEYTKKIRKEYSIYPDFIYKPGRKKVLQHFLQLENIFKTKDFIERYEVQARKNIVWEIKRL